MKRSTWILLSALSLTSNASAADTLASWSETYDSPKTQQAILNRIFPDQVGPLGDAIRNKETGIYLFPKNGSWVRLGENMIYVPKSAGGPYLVVTCMMYHSPERGPITAASYAIYDPSQRPEAISPGYAGSESIDEIKLPKLGKRFVAVIDQFGQGTNEQWNATVIALQNPGGQRTVWKSPNSIRRFQLGFTALDGKEERLVVRSYKGGEFFYQAYRWAGDRFEPDSFVSESALKALPGDVWQYGTPLTK